eukprot:308515-Pyramimonas_sp.AAC.1
MGPPPYPPFQRCVRGRCRGASIGIKNAQICIAKAPLFNIEIGGLGGSEYISVDLYAWWAFFTPVAV